MQILGFDPPPGKATATPAAGQPLNRTLELAHLRPLALHWQPQVDHHGDTMRRSSSLLLWLGIGAVVAAASLVAFRLARREPGEACDKAGLGKRVKELEEQYREGEAREQELRRALERILESKREPLPLIREYKPMDGGLKQLCECERDGACRCFSGAALGSDLSGEGRESVTRASG